MLIAGIDEAGRGALLGPLVVAIFLISENKLPALEELHVKDSKQLSPRQRSSLYRKLKRLGSMEVVKLLPRDIDRRNINQLEVAVVKELLKKHKPDKAYVDCFLKDCSSLRVEGVRVVAEYKADERYPVVSAASIIAKVVRDAEIRKLHRQFGYFGSGYPSDEQTVAFVKEHVRELADAGVIRKKWDTYRRLTEKRQSTLAAFVEGDDEAEEAQQ